MNEHINLLGHSTRGAPVMHPYIRFLRILAICLLFFVPAVSVILYILIALSPLPALKQEENQDLQILSGYHMQIAQLLLIRERTNTIAQIMHTRNQYGTILFTIEKEMPDGLTISAYTFSDTTITITVSGDSLDKANTFLQNLSNGNKTNKLFTNIVLDSLVQDAQTQKIDVTIHMTLL